MNRRRIQLARADRGSVTVELALVAPVLATFIIGIADISTAYSRKLEAEQAAQRAIEKVMQTTGATTVEATIQKEAVCQINGANVDGTCKPGRITTANVTVKYTLKCDGSEKDYALDCDDDELETRYIEATVTDQYTPTFPVHFGTGPDGIYQLAGTAGVRVQ